MLSLTDPAVSEAEAQAYIAARGLLGWPGDEPEQLAALRLGQDYIAREYNHRWTDEWANDDAPQGVKFAIIEAARAEIARPGVLSQIIELGREKVLTRAGEIGWTPAKANASIADLMPRFTAIDGYLRGHVRGSTIFLARA